MPPPCPICDWGWLHVSLDCWTKQSSWVILNLRRGENDQDDRSKVWREVKRNRMEKRNKTINQRFQKFSIANLPWRHTTTVCSLERLAGSQSTDPWLYVYVIVSKPHFILLYLEWANNPARAATHGAGDRGAGRGSPDPGRRPAPRRGPDSVRLRAGQQRRGSVKKSINAR